MQVCLAVVSSQKYEVSSAKFRENLKLYQLMVIQGHQSWCQSKAHMQLPISR